MKVKFLFLLGLGITFFWSCQKDIPEPQGPSGNNNGNGGTTVITGTLLPNGLTTGHQTIVLQSFEDGFTGGEASEYMIAWQQSVWAAAVAQHHGLQDRSDTTTWCGSTSYEYPVAPRPELYKHAGMFAVIATPSGLVAKPVIGHFGSTDDVRWDFQLYVTPDTAGIESAITSQIWCPGSGDPAEPEYPQPVQVRWFNSSGNEEFRDVLIIDPVLKTTLGPLETVVGFGVFKDGPRFTLKEALAANGVQMPQFLAGVAAPIAGATTLTENMTSFSSGNYLVNSSIPTRQQWLKPTTPVPHHRLLLRAPNFGSGQQLVTLYGATAPANPVDVPVTLILDDSLGVHTIPVGKLSKDNITTPNLTSLTVTRKQ